MNSRKRKRNERMEEKWEKRIGMASYAISKFFVGRKAFGNSNKATENSIFSFKGKFLAT